MKRLAICLILALAVGVTSAAPASAGSQQRFFRTADDNIACAMLKDKKKRRRHGKVIPGFPGEARCDILQHVWVPPPKPKSCLDDFGNGLEVTLKGPGRYTCAGDSVRSPTSPILLEGQAITLGRYSCSVLALAVRCTNTANGHGFELSAAQASIF